MTAVMGMMCRHGKNYYYYSVINTTNLPYFLNIYIIVHIYSYSLLRPLFDPIYMISLYLCSPGIRCVFENADRWLADMDYGVYSHTPLKRNHTILQPPPPPPPPPELQAFSIHHFFSHTILQNPTILQIANRFTKSSNSNQELKFLNSASHPSFKLL